MSASKGVAPVQVQLGPATVVVSGESPEAIAHQVACIVSAYALSGVPAGPVMMPAAPTDQSARHILPPGTVEANPGVPAEPWRPLPYVNRMAAWQAVHDPGPGVSSDILSEWFELTDDEGFLRLRRRPPGGFMALMFVLYGIWLLLGREQSNGAHIQAAILLSGITNAPPRIDRAFDSSVASGATLVTIEGAHRAKRYGITWEGQKFVEALLGKWEREKDSGTLDWGEPIKKEETRE